MLLRILILIAVAYLALLCLYALLQRKLLYYPTHDPDRQGLSEWRYQGRLLGYAREVREPRTVWLLMHGNGGQASDRAYAVPSFSNLDSVFIVEYPGYGTRPGSPTKAGINAAAKEAYEALRARFPQTPVAVAGESIGTGPASFLATEPHPPDKIVLIMPFDTLAKVAQHHIPYVPATLLLRDNWNNIKSLKEYRGPIEIFASRHDEIIPFERARALAQSKPSAAFHEIDGGHNEWAYPDRVRIRYP
jgi:uncharacterized protein